MPLAASCASCKYCIDYTSKHAESSISDAFFEGVNQENSIFQKASTCLLEDRSGIAASQTMP